jgi:hypothetical protein
VTLPFYIHLILKKMRPVVVAWTVGENYVHGLRNKFCPAIQSECLRKLFVFAHSNADPSVQIHQAGVAVNWRRCILTSFRKSFGFSTLITVHTATWDAILRIQATILREFRRGEIAFDNWLLIFQAQQHICRYTFAIITGQIEHFVRFNIHA